MAKSEEEIEVDTALIIGRFQPFHNGHLHLIKRALEDAKFVKIVIGSPNKSDSQNPFSADERKNMIEHALKEAKISSYAIFIVDDIKDDSKWVEHIRKHVGRYDFVFAWENGLVAKLFDSAKDLVVVGDKYKDIDATDIREKILEGEDYSDLVPKSVHSYLEKIDARSKVKKASK